MEYRTLGKTGLEVSRLGAGLSEIGQELSLDETEQAGQVVNTALDNGINLLDTASCYVNSEEFVGATVAYRRDDYVLATKAGHATSIREGRNPDIDWTYDTIAMSIDRSLERMKTDHIDIVQLHSCSQEILERGDVIRALQDARGAGKTRFIGYSGDNAEALWAVESGLFDTLQTSFNLVDQRARRELLPKAVKQGMGVLIKRPMGNGTWGADPERPNRTAQWNRMLPRAQAMEAIGPLPGAPDDRIELSFGFTLSYDAVDVALTGTKNPRHMASNLELFERGISLDAETVTELESRFDRLDEDWVQLE
jgi:aryl-alcohol dehydrogenase-like predicted oxidoreductase